MILTCDNCTKRYLVDPRALGASGRRVRCAHCQHTWFQAAPEESQPPIDLPPLPERPPVVRPGEPTRPVQLPAVPRRSRGGWLRVAVAVIVLALAGWGLVEGRDAVMRAAPFTQSLYAMAGLGRAAPGAGLELRAVTPSRGLDHGVPTLAISGEIANISSVARAVPKLRVALRDSANKELRSWTVSISQRSLAPGARVSFHTSIEKPPDSATGVVVSFVSSGS